MLRDIAIVMRGTLIAQGLGFLALPLLTRLFEPAAFGHAQLFVSILTMLLVFSTLRYEVALLRAHEGRELRALAQLCGWLNVATSIIFAVIAALIWLGWENVLERLPFPIWLMPLAMLLGGLARFMMMLVTRERSFTTSARSKIVQSVGYIAAGLGIGATAPVPIGLILADVTGRFFNAAYLGVWSRRRLSWLWKPTRHRDLMVVARRYSEYPFISLPGQVINVLGGQLTQVMIYATFSAGVAGQFGLVERSVNLPLALLIVSISQVFSGQFAAELRRDPDSAASYFRRTLAYMVPLSAAIGAIMAIAGPWLFSLVFGAQWRLAGELAQLMAPAFASILLSGPVTMVLTVLGHQKIQASWEASRLVLLIILWTAALRFDFSLKQVMIGYSAIISFSCIAFVVIAYRLLLVVPKTAPATTR